MLPVAPLGNSCRLFVLTVKRHSYLLPSAKVVPAGSGLPLSSYHSTFVQVQFGLNIAALLAGVPPSLGGSIIASIGVICIGAGSDGIVNLSSAFMLLSSTGVTVAVIPFMVTAVGDTKMYSLGAFTSSFTV